MSIRKTAFIVLKYLLLIYFKQCSTSTQKMNVLLITVDDLRPQLGAYEGQDFPASLQVKMHTPYIDALAAKSLLLKRAYVQVALCSPSRTCLLTGRRPHTTNVFHIGPYFREVGGNFTTIPQYFKINGYSTIGIGKVFHGGSSSAGNDPISWTEPHLDGVSHFENSGRSWSAVPDEQLKVKPLVDQQIADKTIKTLRKFAPKALSGKKPFFVAIGLNKPHLPFVFPKSFMKHYPDVELPENPYAPVNMPSIANYRCSRLYKDVNATRKDEHKNKALSDSYVVNLRRAYYSCVSYIDSLVGRILSELDTLGLSNRTIVSLWGDHGFQLGEHGMWCKHSNFELATHTPMMIHIPGLTDKGVSSRQVTESVDMFPTLVEAAGLPSLQPCPVNSREVALCSEGTNLMPLIKNPHGPLKTAAFSQYQRKGYMGYSMRTDRYRYTEWAKFNDAPEYRPNWSNLAGVELYDHDIDPQENVNRAFNKDYTSIRQELSRLLRSSYERGL